MESKGRRAPRAAGPSPKPMQAASSAETPPGPAKPVEGRAKEPISAKPPAQAVVPAAISIPPSESGSAEPSAEIVAPVAISIAPPGVEAPADTAKAASSGDSPDFGREAFAALAQSQTAVARGLEALSAELAGLALSRIDAAARAATDMLAVKTLSDAIELNAELTRNNIDALFGGSAKLSELGAKLVAEASQPILTQLGRGWSKAARRAF